MSDVCSHGVSMGQSCVQCYDDWVRDNEEWVDGDWGSLVISKKQNPNFMYGQESAAAEEQPKEAKISGGSNDYYTIKTKNGTVECNDIIKALNMTYAEGNAFKAVWRHALARQGKGKPGSTCKYEAEKIEYFGADLVEQAKGE